MKALFIGGTGVISTAVSRLLLENGCDLYLLNRGNRNSVLPSHVHELRADINNELLVEELIKDMRFDVVVDFIAFTPKHVQRDYALFKNKTKQYIFISSASVYQTPLSDYHVNEGTPLSNPYWKYSQDKIACEEYLMSMYRDTGFPVTIVRPTHTYDERFVPLGIHGKNGSWQVVKRIMAGKPVIISGDGTSLWTMTHNSDFARGIAGIMGNIHAIGEAVQITSDETLTWNQIYKCIADALDLPLHAVHISSEFLAECSDYDFTGSLTGDKSNSMVFDNSKLKRLVPSFTTLKRFDVGVRETIEYILSHSEYQFEDAEFDKWCDKVIAARKKAIFDIRGL